MNIREDLKRALELLNTGQWLQLEGSVGRWVQGFIDEGYLVIDYDKTKEIGPVVFVDGYGRTQKQYWAKIDEEKLQDEE